MTGLIPGLCAASNPTPKQPLRSAETLRNSHSFTKLLTFQYPPFQPKLSKTIHPSRLQFARSKPRRSATLPWLTRLAPPLLASSQPKSLQYRLEKPATPTRHPDTSVSAVSNTRCCQPLPSTRFTRLPLRHMQPPGSTPAHQDGHLLLRSSTQPTGERSSHPSELRWNGRLVPCLY